MVYFWNKLFNPAYNLKVVGPFLGSGTTAVVAEQLKRKWKGCDISSEYCGWAASRIELVADWPIEKWIQYDLENEKWRKSIRC